MNEAKLLTSLKKMRLLHMISTFACRSGKHRRARTAVAISSHGTYSLNYGLIHTGYKILLF
jgi:hypothetical protein